MPVFTLPTGQPLAARTQETVDRDGSPVFTDTTTALSASGERNFDLNALFPRSSTYGPLDTVTVINNSAVGVRIFFNGDRDGSRNFPSGTINLIANRSMYFVRIVNLSSTVAINSGELVLEFSRTALTENEVLRRAVRSG